MVISIVCCGLCLWVFNNLLLLLTPGTSRSSRLIFVGLLCLMAPFFIREGIFGHLTGLTLTLIALWGGLKAIEKPDLPAIMVFAVAVSVVIFVQNLLVALLLPLILIFVGSMVQKRQWGPLFTALAAGAVGVVVAWSFKNEVNFTDEQREWSFFNLFRASFDTTGRHWVINLLYCVFFPLMHPGFCLLLPGLFLLFKKTDLHLPAKKIIATSLGLYLFAVGGMNGQYLPDLLPAYLFWLLLLFPAWDRFFAYGRYFFKRTTYAVLFVVFLCQCAGLIWYLQ